MYVGRATKGAWRAAHGVQSSQHSQPYSQPGAEAASFLCRRGGVLARSTRTDGERRRAFGAANDSTLENIMENPRETIRDGISNSIRGSIRENIRDGIREREKSCWCLCSFYKGLQTTDY